MQMCVREQQQPPRLNPLYRGGLGVLAGYRCGPYNALNGLTTIKSNVHLNDYNDLADLPHYARFPFTNSERQDVICGNQLPPMPTEATPARPRPREAACLRAWSNPISLSLHG